jgi:hypothetical protein
MKLRGNKTPVFSCIQPLGTPQIAVFFLFCVRFWHFLVFSVEESKQKNSKHRKRVPTSVFSPSRAAARRLKNACTLTGYRLLGQTLGKCPKPSKNGKERQSMDGRKRTVQLKFRVTEAERDLILEKMKLIPTRNMAAYLRKIAIDGYIIQIDHSDIKAMTAEIQKIGVNVNQIARRVNSTGSVYQEDIDEIKGVLNEIWRLQRLNLLKAR